jgi:hypothetical protein
MIYKKIKIKKNIKVPRQVLGTKKILDKTEAFDYYNIMFSDNIVNNIGEGE